MSTIAPVQPTGPSPLPLPPPEEVFRITVDRYEQMLERGALSEDDRIELLNGVLVTKMPKNPMHSTVTGRCYRALDRLLPPDWHVRKEEPVRIPGYDEPEPDLAVVRGGEDDYEKRHPFPADIALIAEIADSSLTRDRGEKADIYARAGIPVYWIINLVDRQIETFSNPVGGVYPPATILRGTDSVQLVVAGQAIGQIAVADLVPGV